jgi:hypothetical protein
MFQKMSPGAPLMPAICDSLVIQAVPAMSLQVVEVRGVIYLPLVNTAQTKDPAPLELSRARRTAFPEPTA